MSAQPEKEKDLEVKKGKDLEVKIVPEGTFAGHIDKPVLVKGGEVNTHRIQEFYVLWTGALSTNA